MTLAELHAQHCLQAPSHQAAIDILGGHWVSAFPPEMKIVAGGLPHFEDDLRVKSVADIYDLGGKSVLELGPLEAYQTRNLCLAGASPVTAIEGNDIAFLKCLVVKEIFRLDAEFLHGDFTEFLKSSGRTFDVIWASGVLYHQSDPLFLLKLMCDRANAMYIWSHYWEQDNLGSSTNFFVPGGDVTRKLDGFEARYHARSYGGANFPGFSGGSGHSFHYWMERTEIIEFVERQGFSIKFDQHQLDAPPGPVMAIFAVRETSGQPPPTEAPKPDLKAEIAALARAVEDTRSEFAAFRRTIEAAFEAGLEEIKALKRQANSTLGARFRRAVSFVSTARKLGRVDRSAPRN